MTSPVSDATLTRFVDTFDRAISVEMEAMRQRMGPFEVPLGRGVPVEGAGSEDRAADDAAISGSGNYRFPVLQPNDKLVLQAECSLMAGARETLVTIVEITAEQVVVSSAREIDLGADTFTLVIYPWFLYERLKRALHSLLEEEGFYTGNALAAFGRAPARALARDEDLAPSSGHVTGGSGGLGSSGIGEYGSAACPDLNSSQQRAVALCCQRTPAFVWGPPGTGKTTTLGHIVAALVDQGLRVLVTSTTNAAVDQALGRLVGIESCATALDQGLILRIGQPQDQALTHGASLPEVSERLNTRIHDALVALRLRRRGHREQAERCGRLLDDLSQVQEPRQLGFFEETKAPAVNQRELGLLFGPRHLPLVRAMDIPTQTACIERRQARLTGCARACTERIAGLNRELRASEAAVVTRARVILATMTNVYISSLLDGERYDAVIVEEAGMAILPTLFYCAALARDRVILVGDPQQLPPIVQSPEQFVHRAMGRSIFAVTVPEPHDSDLVVMLETQYRMHPAIGGLVSDLFYDGKLRHSDSTAQTAEIAARCPYEGQPIVLIDTEGRTSCATRAGAYSRFNERTAQLCVELALEAVRDGVESVAVITPYIEQSRLIREHLKGHGDLARRVECRTVHRFQGGERDMVILDTVDTEPMAPGVLLAGSQPGSSSANLINVSISRARGKLITVADWGYYRRRAPGQTIVRALDRLAESGLRVTLT